MKVKDFGSTEPIMEWSVQPGVEYRLPVRYPFETNFKAVISDFLVRSEIRFPKVMAVLREASEFRFRFSIRNRGILLRKTPGRPFNVVSVSQPSK